MEKGRDQCHRCGRAGHYARSCSARAAADKPCHRCGRVGHWTRECPRMPTFSHSGEACNRCGKMGHWARECPQPHPNDVARSLRQYNGLNMGPCHRCGENGHWASECPTRSKGKPEAPKEIILEEVLVGPDLLRRERRKRKDAPHFLEGKGPNAGPGQGPAAADSSKKFAAAVGPTVQIVVLSKDDATKQKKKKKKKAAAKEEAGSETGAGNGTKDPDAASSGATQTDPSTASQGEPAEAGADAMSLLAAYDDDDEDEEEDKASDEEQSTGLDTGIGPKAESQEQAGENGLAVVGKGGDVAPQAELSRPEDGQE